MAEYENYEIRQGGTKDHPVMYRTTPKAVVFSDGSNLSTKLKEIKKSIQKIQVLTQEEYDAIIKDPNTLYFIKED